jgi:S-adenosylmethionine:tRNA ribosyltransferase-isomerase
MWNCLVRGLKEGSYEIQNINFVIKKQEDKSEREWVVEIYWKSAQQFSEILNNLGSMPLPPYMKRIEETEDRDRYQTIFAKEIGSIASPTASLHMTSEVLESLKKKNIGIVDVVLHVGLGTFLPMKTDLEHHVMHAEYFEISNETLSKLVSALSSDKKIIALGTTAFRTLESLSWITQWFDDTKEYQKVSQCVWKNQNWSKQEFLDFINSRSDQNSGISGETAIMCTPEYSANIVDILLTNFHQPESTLIQLVSGFVKDDWRQIYQYALDHDFRFLSYGDTSLLWKNTNKY